MKLDAAYRVGSAAADRVVVAFPLERLTAHLDSGSRVFPALSVCRSIDGGGIERRRDMDDMAWTTANGLGQAVSVLMPRRNVRSGGARDVASARVPVNERQVKVCLGRRSQPRASADNSTPERTEVTATCHWPQRRQTRFHRQILGERSRRRTTSKRERETGQRRRHGLPTPRSVILPLRPPSTHNHNKLTTRSQLYRRTLKLALDWTVHRDLWRGQALYLRSLFEANKHVTQPRQQQVRSIPRGAAPGAGGKATAFLQKIRGGS